MRSLPRALVLLLAAALYLGSAAGVQARPQDSRRIDPAQLDEVIKRAHAAADASRERGNRALAQRMNAVARKALSLRERVGDARVPEERVQLDLAQLLRESRVIERDLARSRTESAEARSAWAEVVRTLTGRRERVLGTSGETGADDAARDTRPSTEPERDTATAAPAARPEPAVPGADLLRRTRRVESLSDQVQGADARSLVDRLTERIARVASDIDGMAPQERRDRVKTLLEEARQARQTLTAQNTSPEFVNEWNGLVAELEAIAK